MPTSSKRRPTKAQQAVLDLLRIVHWKVWVTDDQVRAGLGYKDRRALTLAARRLCFALQARGLVESKELWREQPGRILSTWAFRLTRACREVLR